MECRDNMVPASCKRGTRANRGKQKLPRLSLITKKKDDRNFLMQPHLPRAISIQPIPALRKQRANE